MRKNSFKNPWFYFILILLGAWLGRQWYFMPTLEEGARAPQFEAELMDGSTFQMSDLEGNYVLVDFWGSWCGPCRQVNPMIKALYDDFKGKSFENASRFVVLNIGVEKEVSSWKKAIAADQLDWPYHIIDSQDNLRFFNGKLSALWGVKKLPSSFLIDPEGEIIGYDLDIKEIKQILDAQLKS